MLDKREHPLHLAHFFLACVLSPLACVLWPPLSLPVS